MPKRPLVPYQNFKKLLRTPPDARADRFSLKPADVTDHGNRLDRFILKPSDVVFHHPRAKKLHEMTYGKLDEDFGKRKGNAETESPHDYHNPKAEPPMSKDHHGWGHGYAETPGHSAHNPHWKEHKDHFRDHAARLEKHHPKVIKSIAHYKDSGYEHINGALRGDHHANTRTKNHIHNLDRATSFKTKHDMHLYRGMPHHAAEFHNMKPGHEFTDHGFGSHSHRMATASGFAGYDPPKRKHIFKVHVPAGTHAHHFDHHDHDNGHENETVLARGTRYRVTHHSHDEDHHYIHVRVVGQKGRKVKHDASLDGKFGMHHSGVKKSEWHGDFDESIEYEYPEILFEEVERHPKSKMREYSKPEMDWEYHTEYEKYSKPRFPHAFKDREHFQKKYDKAPLRHLTDHEHEHLGNYGGDHDNIQSVHHAMGYRRDVGRVEHDLHHGKTAPPILLKHKHGIHLMAGNTRLSVASAHKKRLPCKVIDITKDD